MEIDHAFLNTKFKANGHTKFNDNRLCAAVFGAEGLAAERKILMQRKIVAARGILKFKDASTR